VWPTQIKEAIWAGKFEYIDFMIKCGADVNIGGVEQSPITSLVRGVDDSEFFRIGGGNWSVFKCS
jgi:hypothetical protein